MGVTGKSATDKVLSPQISTFAGFVEQAEQNIEKQELIQYNLLQTQVDHIKVIVSNKYPQKL